MAQWANAEKYDESLLHMGLDRRKTAIQTSITPPTAFGIGAWGG